MSVLCRTIGEAAFEMVLTRLQMFCSYHLQTNQSNFEFNYCSPSKFAKINWLPFTNLFPFLDEFLIQQPFILFDVEPSEIYNQCSALTCICCWYWYCHHWNSRICKSFAICPNLSEPFQYFAEKTLVLTGRDDCLTVYFYCVLPLSEWHEWV